MIRIFRDRTLLRLALLNLFLGMAEAAFLFRAAFLSANGLSAEWVGTVFAVTNICGVLGPVLGGALADRFRSRFLVFLISLAGLGAGMGLLPLSISAGLSPLPASLILIPALMLFHISAYTLLSTCTVNACVTRKHVDYSSLRIFMSAGFTAAGFCYTPLMRSFGAGAPFLGALAASALCFPFLKGVRDSETVPAEKERRDSAPPDRGPDFRALFRSYYIVSFVLFTLLYAAESSCYSFFAYLLEAKGTDSAYVGTIGGIKVIGEVLILLLLPGIKKKISLSGLQILAGGLLTLSLISVSCAGSLPVIVLSEMLGGLGNGIAISTAGLYVRALSPKGLEATAQSLWSSGTCFGAIILTRLFGAVIEQSGIVFCYRLGALLEFSWVLLFTGSLLFGKYVLKKSDRLPLFFMTGK